MLGAIVIVALTIGPAASYPRPGKTELVSLDVNGRQAHPPVSTPAGSVLVPEHLCGGSDISSDGRFVAFSSAAPLVDGDTNLVCDVFVRDRKTKKVTRVSVASDGSQALPGNPLAGDNSGRPSISGDGRFVAFESLAPNLVQGDTNLSRDMFVHDRDSSTTFRISVDSNENESVGRVCPPLCAHAYINGPSISRDGRFVAFASEQAGLVKDDTNETSDVFVRNLEKGTTERIVGPCHPDGRLPVPLPAVVVPASMNCFLESPSISADGRYVVFTQEHTHVYVHDRKTDKSELASVLRDGSEPNSFEGDNDTYTRSLGGRQISADGRYVVFASHVARFIPSDRNVQPCMGLTVAVRNSMPDVFVRDMKTDRTERVSVHPTGEEAAWGGGDGSDGAVCYGIHEGPTISDNGRFVAFKSVTNFFPRDTGSACANATAPLPCELQAGDPDAFVHDRRTGSLHWISVAPDNSQAECGQEAGPGFSTPAALSHSGRFALVVSCADNLVDGDENEITDLFLRDLGSEIGSGLGGRQQAPAPPDDRICVSPDLCIPPQSSIFSKDAGGEVVGQLARQGAELYGASLAYRPGYDDLFVVIELEEMPGLDLGTSWGAAGSGLPSMLHGLRFEAGGSSYEVRASSYRGGTFGLYECEDAASVCSRTAVLRGGYGTTGKRIVFSLPLGKIGLEQGAELKGVEAYSAVGSELLGPTKILDVVSVE